MSLCDFERWKKLKSIKWIVVFFELFWIILNDCLIFVQIFSLDFQRRSNHYCCIKCCELNRNSIIWLNTAFCFCWYAYLIIARWCMNDLNRRCSRLSSMTIFLNLILIVDKNFCLMTLILIKRRTLWNEFS